jgi:hypothetical protein
MTTALGTKIIVTTKVVGFHRWEDAPEEVIYLARNHRHLFTFRVELFVLHNHRDVEFHTVLRALRAMIPRLGIEAPIIGTDEVWFGKQSCEMLAEALGKRLVAEGYSPSAIEVWEDDENAGRVEFA